MPTYGVSKGQKARFTIEGYVTYNMGGFVGISLRPQDGDEKPPEGEYLDIQEPFIVAEPEVVPPVPSGTIYLEVATGWLWQTDGMKIIRVSGPNAPVEPTDLAYVLSLDGFVRLSREDDPSL